MKTWLYPQTLPDVDRLQRPLAASACIADALRHRLSAPDDPPKGGLRSVLGPRQG